LHGRGPLFWGENGVSIPDSLQSFLIVLSLSLRGGLNSTYAAAALPGKDHIHQVPVFALEKSSSALFPFMEDVVDQVMRLETQAVNLVQTMED